MFRIIPVYHKMQYRYNQYIILRVVQIIRLEAIHNIQQELLFLMQGILMVL